MTYKVPSLESLGMTQREVERYSITRALRGLIQRSEKGGALSDYAPYEAGINRELEELHGKQSRGIMLPPDLFMQRQNRAPPADTTENASLVATEHLSGSFIEGLRQTSVAMQAGATALTGLVGNVAIPREESIPVEWLTEDEDATDVDYLTDNVTLSPTTVAGSVPITRRLVVQSSPDVDVIVRNNLTRGIGEAIDLQAFQGSGVDPLPLGIRGQTGVSTVTISTGALTWAQAVSFETTVEAASNMQAGASYVVHPTMKGIMKTTPKEAGSGSMIWEDNMVNGYPAFGSTHAGATADAIVFGNFSNLLLGFWGTLDVLMDQYSKAASGGLVVRVFQDVDVAVRRGEAFAIESLV